MKWSAVLFWFALGTCIALLSWGMVLFFVSPEDAGAFEWAIFLATSFLSFLGLSSIGILFSRRIFLGSERALARLGTSTRQGGFLAIFLIGVALFFRAGWLTWWVAVFLGGFLFLIELFFLRKFRKKKEEKN